MKKKCSFEECNLSVIAHGYCRKHYNRLSYKKELPPRKTVEERFWSKVEKSGNCWEWTATKTKGYGKFALNGKPEKANRVAWMLTNGKIPDGMCVCHACDNPGCVNPSHLFISDQAGNVRDMYEKGRQPSRVGTANGCAKLCEVDVRLIRDLDGIKHTVIADWFDMDASSISDIKRRKTWAHI